MSNPNVLPTPDKAKVPGHLAAIAAMGAIAFRIEQGPNAPDRTVETPVVPSELPAPQLPTHIEAPKS